MDCVLTLDANEKALYEECLAVGATYIGIGTEMAYAAELKLKPH